MMVVHVIIWWTMRSAGKSSMTSTVSATTWVRVKFTCVFKGTTQVQQVYFSKTLHLQ